MKHCQQLLKSMLTNTLFITTNQVNKLRVKNDVDLK